MAEINASVICHKIQRVRARERDNQASEKRDSKKRVGVIQFDCLSIGDPFVFPSEARSLERLHAVMQIEMIHH